MSIKLKIVASIIFGFMLGIGAQTLAANSKPTDVRVGPTAAIGITTSSDGKIVYVANGNGIFKSTDAGETWNKVY